MKTTELFIKALKETPIILWFSRSWWKYLLKKGDKNYCSKLHRIFCRAAGHPDGVFWYNIGNEPDMTCKGCGDNLE